MDSLAFLGAAALARRLRSGRLGSLELLEHQLARIARHNPTLNAVIQLDAAGARRKARAADARLRRGEAVGPLHGVPMTVKESFDVRGLPTTWGLPAHARRRATRDAVAVQRLEAAGAIVIGKTNVPVMLADWQAFNAVYGTTRNPWALDRSPGGSSGGAAAALAAGLTPLEIGSDIGGSIRIPAHCCGVYGHRPTYGLVPTGGHALPGAEVALDINVVGPLARSAGDLALAFGVLAGEEAGSPWRLALAPSRRTRLRDFRVAVLPTSPVAPAERAVRAALGSLATLLESNKARVSRTAKPRIPMAEAFTLYVHLLRAATSALQMHDPKAFDAAVAVAKRLPPRDHSYYAEQLRGNTMHHRDWLIANERRHALAGAWTDFFRDHDLLLCPAAPIVAFPHDHVGERWQREVLVDGRRRSVNEHLFWAGYSGLFGLPSTVAPIGRDANGLPIGVQIVGAPGADLECIRFAQLLERELGRFSPPPAFAD